MDLLRLGNSDLTVSRIGFGCDQMGLHEWGEVSKQDLFRAVDAALEKGIQLFDTADVYGLGASETLLGEALQGRREKAVIASKFGVRRASGHSYYDNSGEWLCEAVEKSLKRLNTDYLDLYQVHYWDTKTALSDTFEVLERLRAQGKIRYYGVCNIDLSEHISGSLPEGLISFSNQYSLAERKHEAVIERIGALGLAFFSWGTLGQGILTGKYGAQAGFSESDRRSRPSYTNFVGDKRLRNLAIVDLMREMLPRYPGKTLAQIALRWYLDRYSFGLALVGVKRPSQIVENAGALAWRLDPADAAALDAKSG